jgi:hypothetical protein
MARNVPPDARARNLRATLAFLRLPPTEPELRLLHRCFDNWHGLGQIAAGVERRGYGPCDGQEHLTADSIASVAQMDVPIVGCGRCAGLGLSMCGVFIAVR